VINEVLPRGLYVFCMGSYGTNFMAREIVPKTVAAAWVAANAKDNCLLKKCLFGCAYQVK